MRRPIGAILTMGPYISCWEHATIQHWAAQECEKEEESIQAQINRAAMSMSVSGFSPFGPGEWEKLLRRFKRLHPRPPLPRSPIMLAKRGTVARTKRAAKVRLSRLKPWGRR